MAACRLLVRHHETNPAPYAESAHPYDVYALSGKCASFSGRKKKRSAAGPRVQKDKSLGPCPHGWYIDHDDLGKNNHYKDQ